MISECLPGSHGESAEQTARDTLESVLFPVRDPEKGDYREGGFIVLEIQSGQRLFERPLSRQKRLLAGVGLMLGHRLRRWSSINTTLGKL